MRELIAEASWARPICGDDRIPSSLLDRSRKFAGCNTGTSVEALC
jgi:hypothetical protein